MSDDRDPLLHEDVGQGERAPRQCKVYSYGPVIAMRWTPRLGLGYGEHKTHLWPRRWTFSFDLLWWRHD